MPTTNSSPHFFGLDLAVLWSDVRATWQRAHRWRALAWLTPDIPVRVLRADGTEAVWDGRLLRPLADGQVCQYAAIELPPESLLLRSLNLPAMADAQIAQAMALEVSTISPFPAADLVWGHAVQTRPEGGVRVDAALASRKQIAAFFEQQRARLKEEGAEVWAFTEADAPIVFSGWGEAHRAGYAARRRRMGYGLVLGALLLLLAMAATPIAQLRLRAIEAAVGYTELQGRAAPVTAQRAAFMQAIERMGLVRDVLSEQADAIRLIDGLTQVLPDDTSLQSLEIKGLKVRMTGLTANAATLMQLLGQQAGFKDVRAPVAAIRSPGALLDSFNIEFQLEPAVWSVAAVGAVHAAATGGAAAPASPAPVLPAPSPAAPVSANAPPASAASTPPPEPGTVSARPKSRFSSGDDAPRPAAGPSKKAQP